MVRTSRVTAPMKSAISSFMLAPSRIYISIYLYQSSRLPAQRREQREGATGGGREEREAVAAHLHEDARERGAGERADAPRERQGRVDRQEVASREAAPDDRHLQRVDADEDAAPHEHEYVRESGVGEDQ